jgi:hypothetical protein
MYCPKCGRVMSVIDGWTECSTGSMQLSRNMEKLLLQRFPEQMPRKAPAAIGSLLSRWFCPGCGIPLNRDLKCGSCGKSISDLHYQLVELHPHNDE